MEIKAKLNYLRIAPRKVRLIADLVRNMDVKEAETQLKFMSKRASISLLKLLNSAIANAKNNFNLEKDVLYIKKLTINEGPPFKRWRPIARGRANPIVKKSTHINLVLDVKKGVKIVESPKPEAKETKSAEVPQQRDERREKQAKPKPRALKEITKRPERKGLFKKIFRRKSF